MHKRGNAQMNSWRGAKTRGFACTVAGRVYAFSTSGQGGSDRHQPRSIVRHSGAGHWVQAV